MNLIEMVIKEQFNARILRTIEGGFVVRCLTHNKIIPVSATCVLETDCLTLVSKALENCPECQQPLPPTRWPEGAEL